MRQVYAVYDMNDLVGCYAYEDVAESEAEKLRQAIDTTWPTEEFGKQVSVWTIQVNERLR